MRTIAIGLGMALLAGGCATRLANAPGDPALARSALIANIDDDMPVDPTAPARQIGASHDILLLSGGGSVGAFGAGVLVGWTESGKRPSFDVVTGVSTGALMATLAFLGPDHDGDLRRAYTGITQRQVLRKRGLFGLARNGALYDRRPLEATIASVITDDTLTAVAREWRKGRRLYVASTDLDAGVTLFWDMGRIAASPSPDRLRLYRQVLMASAAVPGVFQPVYIRVGDRTVMNVDGGAKVSLAFRSFMIDPKGTNERIWTIVNGHISYRGAEEKAGANAPSIVGRSIAEMLRTITYRTLVRTYVMARNGGAKFGLAYLPDDVAEPNPIKFDPVDMQRLFDYGLGVGKAGKWATEPPRLERLEKMP